MRALSILFVVLVLLPPVACDLLFVSENRTDIPGRELLYRGPYASQANSVTALPSGVLVVAGYTDGRRGPLDGITSVPLLLRVDPDGHIADTTVYHSVDDGEIVGALPYRDGLAVLFQEEHYDQENSHLPNATLYQTSLTGTRTNRLFERVETFLSRQSFFRTSEGGFVLALSPSGGRPDELVKLDRRGDAVWTLQKSGVRSAIRAAGGDVLVLSRRNPRQFDLTRLTSGGQERWHHTYGNDTLRRAEAIVPAGRGAAVLETRSVPNSKEAWVVVTRVDEAGDVAWKREYARGLVSATSFTALPTGGFALGFTASDRESGPHRSFVVRLDGEGNQQWQRRFGPREGNTHVNALTARPDGTITAAGSTCPEFNRWVICGDLLLVTYDAE